MFGVLLIYIPLLDLVSFWFDAASRFHATHLCPGKSYVQDSFAKEGRLGLGNTFQLLMNLIVFFDRFNAQHWEVRYNNISYIRRYTLYFILVRINLTDIHVYPTVCLFFAYRAPWR